MNYVDLPRPRRRLTEFLYNLSQSANSIQNPICRLKFLCSPVEIIPKSDYKLLPFGKSAVKRVKLSSTRLEVGFVF